MMTRDNIIANRNPMLHLLSTPSEKKIAQHTPIANEIELMEWTLRTQRCFSHVIEFMTIPDEIIPCILKITK